MDQTHNRTRPATVTRESGKIATTVRVLSVCLHFGLTVCIQFNFSPFFVNFDSNIQFLFNFSHYFIYF